jgi:hypothetical protein
MVPTRLKLRIFRGLSVESGRRMTSVLHSLPDLAAMSTFMLWMPPVDQRNVSLRSGRGSFGVVVV